MKRATLILALGLAASCTDPSLSDPVTGVRLIVERAAGVDIDQLRVQVFAARQEAAAGTLPPEADGLLPVDGTADILVDDSLGGRRVQVRATGLLDGGFVFAGQAPVDLVTGELVELTITLDTVFEIGDGEVTEGIEECDDGNPDSGDGCNEHGLLEPGFECPVPGQPCVPDGPPPDGGVPPDAGAPPPDGGVPPDDGGVPPDDGGVPPVDDGGVPPDDGGVPPVDDGGVPPDDGGVPPDDGGVPCVPRCLDDSTAIECVNGVEQQVTCGGVCDLCSGGLCVNLNSLIFTEVMIAPPGGDSARQYMEIFNPSTTTPVDLTGWVLAWNPPISQSRTLTGGVVPPQGYLVIAGSAAEDLNCGIGADLGVSMPLQTGNTLMGLLAHDRICNIDILEWNNLTPDTGVSYQLIPGQEGEINRDPENTLVWCEHNGGNVQQQCTDSGGPTGDLIFGTPGEPNICQ
jgi:cysteine-rich repeat protein